MKFNNKHKKTALALAMVFAIGYGTASTTIKRPHQPDKLEQTQTTVVQTDSERQRQLEDEVRQSQLEAEAKAKEDAAKQEYYRQCLKNGYSTPGFTPNEAKVKADCERAAQISV